MSATSTEKSTLDRGKLNAVNVGQSAPEAAQTAPARSSATGSMTEDLLLESAPADVPLACSIDDPDCEACQ